MILSTKEDTTISHNEILGDRNTSTATDTSSPIPLTPTTTTTTAESNRRCNYYNVADNAFIKDVKEFLKLQKQRVQSYGPGWVSYLREWMNWMDVYLETGETKDMPKSWSSNSPIPVVYIINEGDAGTGKTFCTNTLMQTLPDGTVSATAAKGTDAYLQYAVKDTIPQGVGHIIQNNTMCKMFRIRYSSSIIVQHMDQVKNDAELEQSYKSLRQSIHACSAAEVRTKLTRKHFKMSAQKLRPLITECYTSFMEEYVRRKHNSNSKSCHKGRYTAKQASKEDE